MKGKKKYNYMKVLTCPMHLMFYIRCWFVWRYEFWKVLELLKSMF